MAVMIAGGGIAGLTTALALARRGLASTVIEQAPAIEAVGAGLQLSPNATRVLFALGLEKALSDQSVAPPRAEVRDAASGRLLVGNRLGAEGEARWRAPYLTLTRTALQSALLEAVEATGRVEFRFGRAIVGARIATDGVEVQFEGGEFATADVLLGCDGVRSTVRTAILGPEAPRYTGQTAWRGLARMSGLDAAPVQVWAGPQRHFVRYPVAPGMVNMVAVVEARLAEVESWTTEGRREDLAAAFADWPEPVRGTIGAVERPWRSALYDRAPFDHWTKGRATLIGDAAHPMLPFLAQGAGMAIEDAFVVAKLLAEMGDPGAALTAYEQVRRARAAKVQNWASRNARLFHLPSTAATGVFGAAKILDRLRGRDAEARFDWLYGWAP